MPLDAGLVLGGIGGVLKTGLGLSNASAGSADLAGARRPVYAIPKEWYDIDNVTANQAQTGLSAPAMNYYTTMANRGFGAGVGATLQTGGDANDIAGLYDQYDQGVNKIAAEDSELKNSHIQNWINAHANLGNEQEKKFTLNEYESYKDRVRADNQKIAAGQQTAFNGLSDITNSLASYNTSKLYKERTDAMAAPTMGDKLGIDPLDGGQTPAGIPPAAAGGMPSPFTTPGGMAALKNIVANNPRSPYVQQLLALVNKNQPQ